MLGGDCVSFGTENYFAKVNYHTPPSSTATYSLPLLSYMKQTKDAAPEMILGQSFRGVAVPPSFVLGFITKLGQQERFCKG